MQKDRGWIADLKTRKLRGFGVRNWADLELLLNWLGLRVDSGKAQGLFSKTARLKRYLRISAVGSRSDGSDRTGTRTNPTRPKQIGRIRWKGVGGGGAGCRETLSHGGASPKMIDSGVPGAKSTRVWVRDGLHDMRDPPVA